MEKHFDVLPCYDDSIVGITASIVKYYDGTPAHKTCCALDSVLTADYRNVVLLVLDGMGSGNMRDLLGDDCFLSRHKIKDLSSVFPTTTTAAMTSFETGLTPLEHGWLGWELYFGEEKKSLALFENYEAANREIPKNSVFSKMKGVKFVHLSPFEDDETRVEQLQDIAMLLPALTKKRGKKFIFAYSVEPDKTLHDYGNFARETKGLFESINNVLERLRRELNDTLLIITADHGHIDAPHWIDTDKIAGLADTLRIPRPVMEPRAAGFFVKEGQEEAFLGLMTAVIGDKGVVLTRAEAEPLFGEGVKNQKFDELCGDFVVVMTGDTNLWSMADMPPFKSVHSGLTARELTVPLITVTCPKVRKKQQK